MSKQRAKDYFAKHALKSGISAVSTISTPEGRALAAGADAYGANMYQTSGEEDKPKEEKTINTNVIVTLNGEIVPSQEFSTRVSVAVSKAVAESLSKSINLNEIQDSLRKLGLTVPNPVPPIVTK